VIGIIRGDRADKNHYVNFEEGGVPPGFHRGGKIRRFSPSIRKL